MLIKGISYLDIWQPFGSAKYSYLCNLGRGYYEEQFCEIILNLGQWFKSRCCLKISYLKLFGPSCSVERNHLCNFEGIMGNLHVMLYEIWTSGSGDVV